MYPYQCNDELLRRTTISTCTSLLNANGPDLLLLNTLGNNYMACGDFAAAASCYEQSLALDPGDAVASNFLKECKEKDPAIGTGLPEISRLEVA